MKSLLLALTLSGLVSCTSAPPAPGEEGGSVAGEGVAIGGEEEKSPAPTTIRWYPLTLSLTVPDPGWEVEIQEVAKGNEGLLVRGELLNGPGMSAQVISQAEASFLVGAEPGAKVHYYLEGKRWNWTNTEPDITFIENEADFAEVMERSRAEPVPWRAD